jgi:hypothetical protein
MSNAPGGDLSAGNRREAKSMAEPKKNELQEVSGVLQKGVAAHVVLLPVFGSPEYFQPPKIPPQAFDAGYVEVALSYRRGSPPEGWPAVIRLTAPPVDRIRMCVAKIAENPIDGECLLLACLPDSWSNWRFLEALDVFCLNFLVDAAAVLCLGEKLCKEMAAYMKQQAERRAQT